MAERYTRERVAAATSAARTLSDAVRALGREPTASARRYLRKRAVEWGVDLSHLEPENVRHTERRLRDAVRESTSVAEVVRRLGISPVGGNQAHIGRRIRSFGIDTSHFTPRAHTAEPGRKGRTARGVLVRQTSGDARRVHGERLRRAMLESGVADRCALCGLAPVWRGRPLPLEVDHVDGDWRNNVLENLRLLCPNCHSVTDTYRGRARGRAVKAS